MRRFSPSYHRPYVPHRAAARRPRPVTVVSDDVAPTSAPYALSFQGPDELPKNRSPKALAARMEALVVRGMYGRPFDRCLEMGNADEVIDCFLARCDADPGLTAMVDPFYVDLDRLRADQARRRAEQSSGAASGAPRDATPPQLALAV